MKYLLSFVVDEEGMGDASPEEMQESARRSLNGGTASFQIERQLWSGGAVATNPSFNSAGVNVTGASFAMDGGWTAQ